MIPIPVPSNYYVLVLAKHRLQLLAKHRSYGGTRAGGTSSLNSLERGPSVIRSLNDYNFSFHDPSTEILSQKVQYFNKIWQSNGRNLI